MAAWPTWKRTELGERLKLEMFAPSLIHRISRSSRGERTRAVKVLDTTVGGFFSGSRNKCWISGLGM
uniref:Uncharacterized protein n=1 Tax=Anguilla anguilla TaxID=7936 RepID=A0A0E9WZP2_ANGAN